VLVKPENLFVLAIISDFLLKNGNQKNLTPDLTPAQAWLLATDHHWNRDNPRGESPQETDLQYRKSASHRKQANKQPKAPELFLHRRLGSAAGNLPNGNELVNSPCTPIKFTRSKTQMLWLPCTVALATSPPLSTFNASFEGGNIDFNVTKWVGENIIQYKGARKCGPASTECSPYTNW
jgi:hypothetical protein